MVNNHWGRIINISSIFGIRGVDRNLPYTVSKHGLSGLTKTIAKEYARMGITCNEICPGPIDSEMIRRIAADKFREEGVNPQEYLSELENEIPAGRLSKVEDVTSLCVFLASKDAQYINGVSIPVDGGLTC